MRLESGISAFRGLKDVLVGKKTAVHARISQSSALFHSFRRVRSWLAKATGRRSAGKTAAEDVQIIVDSGMFDEAWYLSKYGHAIQPGMHPITHYLRHGVEAGLDPSPRFNTKWYLESYADVRKSGRNPLVHYLRWGRNESRLPLPDRFWLNSGPLPTPDPLPTSDVHGNLDGFSDGIISGWARGRRDGKPVEVEILVNDIPYKRVRADRARADIDIPGRTEAAVGFSVPIDIEQFDARVLRFSARISDGGNPLGSWLPPIQLPGPATLRRRAVRPLPLPSRATIIIPVFNAPAEVKACVEAVLANLPPWAELIISDDASTDAAINPLLGSFEGLEGVRIVRKSENVGYTGNINDAIRLVSAGDVVLLNSDTLVPPNWLRLLQRAAYSEDRVGTVTSLSDNAGAFSAPAAGLKNHPPAWHGAEEFSRLVANASRRVYPVVPTGSGFCFYIRRDLIDAIGLFDQEAFPRGYGEENDFCMRAQRAGWKNIVADDVYVRHARSASFKETKSELIARAAATVSKRYPKYLREVRSAFTDSDEFCGVRYRIADSSLHRPDSARPRILFVLGVESGGTPQTNYDLMDSIQSEFESILFLSDTRRGRVFRMIGRTKHVLEEFQFQDALTPTTHDSPEYAMHVARILDDHAIEAVHVRHLGRHGLSIIEGAKAKGIPVILSFHDFYAVCPNVKLVDAAGRHCGGVCTSGDIADCNVELWEPGEVGFPPLRHGWVRNWQLRMAAALDSADHFVTTSSLARDLITSIYPRTAQKPFDVIEHGRDFPAFKSLAAPLEKGEPLRILLPGILVPAKGLELVRAIKALDTENRIEFHFLGQAVLPLKGLGVSHGKYVMEKFAAHVEKIRPHVGAILSIWPETYCHTITEMWAAGCPLS
jgi:GT2 family glycosyltransferase